MIRPENVIFRQVTVIYYENSDRSKSGRNVKITCMHTRVPVILC